MLKLIVNGDDFGFNEKVNEEIIKCSQYGILRSASLMANGKSFDHAIGIIRSNLNLDVGIHFALVDEHPVLKAEHIRSLINEDGNLFSNAIQFTKKYFLKRIDLKEVRKELSAQIEKILDYGIIISHIDSHQHLHILPGILDVVSELADRYAIKFIRLPMENLCSYMYHDPKSINRIAQLIALNYLCFKAKSKINLRTDFFAGYYFGGNLSKQNLLKLINNLPASGSCELMCHPGFFYRSGVENEKQYRKIDETQAVIDQEVAKVLKQRNIEISSFRSLLS